MANSCEYSGFFCISSLRLPSVSTTNWGAFNNRRYPLTVLEDCRCSVAKSCPTFCNSIYCMPGSSVLHYLPEFAQIHVHWVDDAIQPSHPLPPLTPFAFNLSHSQDLFQRVNSSHQGAKVLELLVSAAQQSESAICIHIPLFFGFPSHLGHHRALRKVPCAIQQVLIGYLFYTQYQ